MDRPLAIGEILLYEEPGNGFITIRFDSALKGYLVHMDCKEWSLSTYKRYKKIWAVVLKNLKEAGVTKFYGTVQDKKSLKFNKMFNCKYTGKDVILENGKRAYLVQTDLI